MPDRDNTEDIFKSMLFNKLNTVKTTKLEEIIAKTVSGYLDMEYECTVTSIIMLFDYLIVSSLGSLYTSAKH